MAPVWVMFKFGIVAAPFALLAEIITRHFKSETCIESFKNLLRNCCTEFLDITF